MERAVLGEIGAYIAHESFEKVEPWKVSSKYSQIVGIEEAVYEISINLEKNYIENFYQLSYQRFDLLFMTSLIAHVSCYNLIRSKMLI
jgi:hypothetical protein